ncbi:4-hydroxythreonine-4-phosphate dehydrogenase PdxA [Rhizosphaericola mali]|uniref:4-hydroxythreonine-4-phosphate dehydrogenase PdxA n=1 Tax=Rhizosphaericola mali TaxID=2545455 RepID=A0A5P2G740_9BACT|nr:4-hydroxythreonine-4-phosphate dehydrogenase PdxA [Rhizosphaericola mali]QES89752.1 4-hydroxythreonine-4-phosphate dehydrogenase PdxA [Rhizosphaericola mali]
MEKIKPIIGFSCGDLNGVGLEVVIKAVSNNQLLSICTPIIFANNKCINFYKKGIIEGNFNFTIVKDLATLNTKQVNVYNCWEEDVAIQPGQMNTEIGKYAWISLKTATEALKNGEIHALVTAPIHKKTILSDEFHYTGHTPFLKEYFDCQDVVMFMCAENMRVAVVTEHIPIKEVANSLDKDIIVSKLKIIQESLRVDFGITKPKIAVLGLNPHASDDGLIGNEEETIIKPAIKLARNKDILAFGPYPADGFFAHGHYNNFDAVLAMYHDQGMIPFKSLAIGEGVNYTAGMPVVRTSPDHGTAMDIAGKGIADSTSTLESIFLAVDIVRMRFQYEEDRADPIKKMSERILGNLADEKIVLD